MARRMISGSIINRRRSWIAWLLVLLFLIVGTWAAVTPVTAAREDALKKARDCTHRLYRSKKRIKYRDQWIRCIRAYAAYYRKYPRGRQADEALYSMAKLYQGLYGYSRRSSDLDESINRFRQVVKKLLKGSPKADLLMMPNISWERSTASTRRIRCGPMLNTSKWWWIFPKAI
jgi:hypothetical protein